MPLQNYGRVQDLQKMIIDHNKKAPSCTAGFFYYIIFCMNIDTQNIEQQKEAVKKMADDIFVFVYACFKMKPQPARPEYQKKLDYIYSLEGEMFEEGIKMIGPEWFGTYEPDGDYEGFYRWYHFERGKHLTWQQTILMMCANKAMQGKGKRRVTVASGHGVGKSSSCAIIVLWFLFGRINSQIACTAPTATQMHDVLWKEISIWISRMPDVIRDLYDHTSDYVRIKEQPKAWFARAKTSSKENSEALAGVHSATGVMLLSDEASGIEEQIFVTMDATLTEEKYLVILIGNPTRNNGYFYDSHNRNRELWITLHFSGMESPLVTKKYEEEQALLHGGRETEQYGIRVLGKFPSEDTMSKDGYIRLFGDRDLNTIPKTQELRFGKNSILGVDPSGDGEDATVMFIRDDIKGKVLFKESISNVKSIAEKIITFIDFYELNPRNVVVDAFGIGANIAHEVAKATRGRCIISPVNVGEPCDFENDRDNYINKRALYFHKEMKNWMRAGGQIVEDATLEKELDTIYYRRGTNGRVQIMPKVEMKKRGYNSPNVADAVMLTFHRNYIKNRNDDMMPEDEWMDRATSLHTNYDPFDGLL